MSRIQDRKKQRSEYLRKKGMAYMMASLAGLLTLLFSMVALLTLGFAVSAFFWPMAFDDGVARVYVYVLCGLLVLCFGWASFLLARSARKAHQAASQLPYVPLITTDSLPSEEVLLRCSGATAQEQSQILLRSTHNTEAADGQELLRSSQVIVGAKE